MGVCLRSDYEDWGILWKRTSAESGQHIRAFITFWAIAKHPPLAMDKVENLGKDMLWYGFVDRQKEKLCDGNWNRQRNKYKTFGNGPDGYG